MILLFKKNQLQLITYYTAKFRSGYVTTRLSAFDLNAPVHRIHGAAHCSNPNFARYARRVLLGRQHPPRLQPFRGMVRHTARYIRYGSEMWLEMQANKNV